VKVTFSNGRIENVYPVPPFALAIVAAMFPADGDPATIAAREQKQRETAWLIGFQGLAVPEDWQFPEGLRYAGIEPRAGEQGRLLDYIEYGLLLRDADIAKTQAVMYGETVTEEEITAAEAVFPGNG
jgi:hypothetical protein